jgi:hypothetical protein
LSRPGSFGNLTNPRMLIEAHFEAIVVLMKLYIREKTTFVNDTKFVSEQISRFLNNYFPKNARFRYNSSNPASPPTKKTVTDLVSISRMECQPVAILLRDYLRLRSPFGR